MPVLDDLRHSGIRHRDDRQTGATCFERGKAKRLPHARENEDVALRKEVADLVSTAPSQKVDLIAKAEPRDGPLESRALRAVADDAQPNVLAASQELVHSPHHLDESERPLLRVEAHDGDQLDRAIVSWLPVRAPVGDVDGVR